MPTSTKLSKSTTHTTFTTPKSLSISTASTSHSTSTTLPTSTTSIGSVTCRYSQGPRLKVVTICLLSKKVSSKRIFNCTYLLPTFLPPFWPHLNQKFFWRQSFYTIHHSLHTNLPTNTTIAVLLGKGEETYIGRYRQVHFICFNFI